MFAIGVDIERVDRFKNKTLNKDEYFLKSIFSDIELSYSFSDIKSAQHLCVRFCAKEAAIKALYSLGFSNVHLKDIEVINDCNGVPQLKIKDYENLKIKVSLSHTIDNAVAFVLIEI